MPSPLAAQLTRLVDQISTIIVGKRSQIEDCIACLLAGGHLLIEDVPGVGKTMMARRVAGVMPPLTIDEALEATSIHSVAGLVPPGCGLLTARPFRAPHHTVSDVALVGGGQMPRPGEISLAHHGVLFLDEMAEFSRHVLEVLRQPIEEGVVRIARAARTVVFPARFMLIGAMNPCPCGFLGDDVRVCRCPPQAIARYASRLSGPLRDRIDLTVPVHAVRDRARPILQRHDRHPARHGFKCGEVVTVFPLFPGHME